MSFQPTVTFNHYERNSITEDISSNDVVLASGSIGEPANKTMKVIVVDPIELSTTSVDTHSYFYDVTPNTGNENYYQGVLSSGYASGSKSRVLGMDKVTWGVGTTSIELIVDIDSGFEGSGSQQAVVVPNSGTTWSPPFGSSGTYVFDVPTLYNGSFLAVVQPTDWDGDITHRLHDWQPIQVNVGHAVEVAGTDLSSGTKENNIFTFEGSAGKEYYINFKTYHEYPKEWEWYSGSTLIQSGSQSGSFVDNTWLFIDGLNIHRSFTSGSTTYNLKLYGSGSVEFPTALRSLNINIITPDVGGRFGIGQFGISQFGRP